MSDVTPRMPIRRFDVFAEYNRQKNLADGMPEDQAAGNGIWIAKIVAGRRGMPAHHDPPTHENNDGAELHGNEPKERFKSVGGESQTDTTFQHEIVDRMGREFYENIFRPAIDAARHNGQRYEDIRDTIRKDWKPRK